VFNHANIRMPVDVLTCSGDIYYYATIIHHSLATESNAVFQSSSCMESEEKQITEGHGVSVEN